MPAFRPLALSTGPMERLRRPFRPVQTNEDENYTMVLYFTLCTSLCLLFNCALPCVWLFCISNDPADSIPPEPSYDRAMEVRACIGGGGRLTTDKNAEHVLDLRYDLISRVRFTNKFFPDYLFFVCNRHPMLGMVFCHPVHPWRRIKRLFTFVIQSAYTVAGLFIYETRYHIHDRRSDSAWAPAEWKPVDPHGLWTASASPEHLDLVATLTCWTWPQERLGMAACSLDDKVMLFLTVSLPTIAVVGVLTWLVTADAKLPSKHTIGPGCHDCLRSMFSCCNRTFFLLNGALATAAVLVAYDIAQKEQTHEIKFWALANDLVQSKLQQIFTWFPITFFMPFSGFLHMWFSDASRDQYNEKRRIKLRQQHLASTMRYPAASSWTQHDADRSTRVSQHERRSIRKSQHDRAGMQGIEMCAAQAPMSNHWERRSWNATQAWQPPQAPQSAPGPWRPPPASPRPGWRPEQSQVAPQQWASVRLQPAPSSAPQQWREQASPRGHHQQRASAPPPGEHDMDME